MRRSGEFGEDLVDNDVQPILDAVSAFAELPSNVEDLLHADLRLFLIESQSCLDGLDGVGAVKSVHSLFLFAVENVRQLPASCIASKFHPHVDCRRPDAAHSTSPANPGTGYPVSPREFRESLQKQTGGTSSRERPCPRHADETRKTHGFQAD